MSNPSIPPDLEEKDPMFIDDVVVNVPGRADQMMVLVKPDYLMALRERIKRLNRERHRIDGKVHNQKRELKQLQDKREEKNRELDAMYYVWCDGGCGSGVCRYGHTQLATKDIVELAVRNTERLVKWHNNMEFRKLSVQCRMEYFRGSLGLRRRVLTRVMYTFFGASLAALGLSLLA